MHRYQRFLEIPFLDLPPYLPEKTVVFEQLNFDYWGEEFYNQMKYFKFIGFHFCNENKSLLLKENKHLL